MIQGGVYSYRNQSGVPEKRYCAYEICRWDSDSRSDGRQTSLKRRLLNVVSQNVSQNVLNRNCKTHPQVKVR